MRASRWLVALLLASAAPAFAQEQDESVPFELVQNIIVVRGTVNGASATWVVDTGCNQTVVTPAAARRAGLEGEGWVRCPRVSAGRAVVREITVAVDDPEVAHFLRKAGLEYDGILGTTYLKNFLVTIDYQNRRLRLSPAGSTIEGGTVVPFEMKNGLIIVEARPGGGGSLTMLFDCGAQTTLLRPSSAARVGIAGRKVRSNPGVELARLESLRLGDAAVSALDVQILEPSQAGSLDTTGIRWDGFLGYNFLSRFRVTIDYENRSIRLAPPEDATAARGPPPRPGPEPPSPPPPVREEPRPPLGLTLSDTRVDEVDRGSAAEKAGFKAGDRILTVEGQEVRYVEEIRAILLGTKRGATILFSVRRGKEKLSIKLVW